MASSSNSILEKIDSLKNNYYTENKKNTFFKSGQKFDCANTIVQQMNKTDLFNSIIRINENQLLVNYTMFKTIIHPAIYIDGVQGRYLLIPAVLIAYALSGQSIWLNRPKVEKTIMTIVFFFALYCAVITMNVLLERYYIQAN